MPAQDLAPKNCGAVCTRYLLAGFVDTGSISIAHMQIHSSGSSSYTVIGASIFANVHSEHLYGESSDSERSVFCGKCSNGGLKKL